MTRTAGELQLNHVCLVIECYTTVRSFLPVHHSFFAPSTVVAHSKRIDYRVAVGGLAA
jgi:hypothetical protein